MTGFRGQLLVQVLGLLTSPTPTVQFDRTCNTFVSRSCLRSSALVAGAWSERKKMFHGGSFLKLADDNMDIQNPEAQNRELSGF